MGWISHKCFMRGTNLRGNSGRQRKGPLRRIICVLRPADGLFSTAKVALECGHEVSSNGQFRARCWRCAREATE